MEAQTSLSANLGDYERISQLDEFHLSVEAMMRRVTDLDECVAGGEVLFRIKEASFEVISPSDKKFRKAVRYYRKLEEVGLLENLPLTGGAVLQRLRGGAGNCFLGFGSAANGSAGFLSTTSTETSLNRAVNRASGENGGYLNEVNTITGMCFFGSGVDRAITEMGREISVVEVGRSETTMAESVGSDDTIVDMKIDSELSLYEREKLVRLSRFRGRLSGPAESGVSILVTPRVQYYLYLMPLFEKNRIEGEAILKWFEAVNEREALVREEFAKKAISRVRFAKSPLASIEHLVTRSVRSGRMAEFQRVLAVLSEDDEIWRRIIGREKPRTWKRLINLSYVVAFIEQIHQFSGAGKLLVHVDDQVERVILSETGRLKKLFRGEKGEVGPLVGVYLLQSIIDQSASGDSDLYYRRENGLDVHHLLNDRCNLQ